MNKQNQFPTAMNDIGQPSEMSPINGAENNHDTDPPLVEINQPLKTQNHLEVRDQHSS
ncbi:hypothetical protein [Neobacillus dielmonensis]|uniref:hypothetical protein n=1 Tax=Neobacillus dielmonensis TaxID=1347369 RepID=UPI0012B65F59|nr:hypothetical protein [Neobacillus dielmonensis]